MRGDAGFGESKEGGAVSNLNQRRNWVRSVLASAHEEEIPHFLQHLADGPICQPWSIYCPAGKLSWAETREREAAQIAPESDVAANG